MLYPPRPGVVVPYTPRPGVVVPYTPGCSSALHPQARCSSALHPPGLVAVGHSNEAEHQSAAVVFLIKFGSQAVKMPEVCLRSMTQQMLFYAQIS